MATISKEQNGNYRIQVFCPDGRRRSITIKTRKQSKNNRAQAKTIATHIENCISNIEAFGKLNTNELNAGTAEWLESTTEWMREKLRKIGVLQPAKPVEPPKTGITVEAYLAEYFRNKELGVKPATATFYQHTANRLTEFFKGRELASITGIDAKRFRYWLETESNKRDKKGEDGKPIPLAENTVRRRIGVCKQVFAEAVTDGLIAINPFFGKSMASTVKSNESRQEYIEPVVLDKLLKALADEGEPSAFNARWRALICLARQCGFRMPSEAAGLKWEHILWDKKLIAVVMSSKTAHHKKRAVRHIPLQAETEAALSDLREHATEGAEFVFPDIDLDTNLRTHLLRILARAGVAPWPKLWQNLRASASTDFARALPAHVAAEICGHTIEIAKEHYWMVMEDDLRNGLGATDAARARLGSNSVHESKENVQKTGSQSAVKADQNESENECFAGVTGSSPNVFKGELVGEEGLEQGPFYKGFEAPGQDSCTFRGSLARISDIEGIAEALELLAWRCMELGRQDITQAILQLVTDHTDRYRESLIASTAEQLAVPPG